MNLPVLQPDDWRTHAGEYELLTEQGEGSRGPPFRSVLRLRLASDQPGLTGEEEYAGAGPGVTVRQPVAWDGAELLIGDPAAEGGPSRYRITRRWATGFGGEWRTYQPAALRARQPGTPEWAGGPFSAVRRTA